MAIDYQERRQQIKSGISQEKKFLPTIKEIMFRHLNQIISIEEATEMQDMKECFDCILTTNSKRIAVRIREDIEHRDFTIRSKLKSGAETEIDKIRRGFGELYFYAWKNEEGEIGQYLIVDLNRFRDCGLIDKPSGRNIPNVDGVTFFHAFDTRKLNRHGCLIANQRYKVAKIRQLEPKPIEPRSIQDLELFQSQKESLNMSTNNFEIKGVIFQILDLEQKTEKFSVQKFVIESESDSNYPQKILFQCINDYCDQLANLTEGEPVKVHFNLKGREWNGKYFTNLQAWRIERESDIQQQQANETNATDDPKLDFPTVEDDEQFTATTEKEAANAVEEMADDLPF